MSIFPWDKVPVMDEKDVELFLSSTDVVGRQFPLNLALQVNDIAIRKLQSSENLDAMGLAEQRGWLRAMSTFGKMYAKAIGYQV